MQPKKEIQHPPLKAFEKMCLKEQHPTELQSRNPGPRSNKTNGISSMHPGQGVHLWCSCLVPSRYLHGLDGSTICICCFSIFSILPPVCLVCCIPRVQTIFATFLSLVSPTYLRALPPILGQNLHVTACVTFQFSRSHHPFTWLQTLL